MAEDRQDRLGGRCELYDPRAKARGPDNTPKSCWFCKQTGTHTPGIRNCPECQQLVKEGLLIDNGYKIMMSNGDRLPGFHVLGNETVEQYVRRMHHKGISSHQGHTSSALLVEPWIQNPTANRHMNNTNWSSNDVECTEKKNV